MRLSTIFFSLAALFVAVSATPGYSVNKRGELSSRQDCCEDPPGCGCPDTSNELKEAEGNLFAAPQIQTMSTVMTVSGDSVKRHREAAQRPEWATHLNITLKWHRLNYTEEGNWPCHRYCEEPMGKHETKRREMLTSRNAGERRGNLVLRHAHEIVESQPFQPKFAVEAIVHCWIEKGSGGASKYPGAPKQLVADDAFDGLRDRQGYSGSDVHEKNAEK
ncbi:hypothetical protein C8F04DRAFT_1228312 [Mycena alexandri]|uniref:Uncharacterized protein n=1 Tax=Mycena alexandri TaxID=1745969 RepID=A0AAD6TGL5_9AGAR|nr:hypothetical protein C8F04DRAFT_1228312 [Mycena alexandri]